MENYQKIYTLSLDIISSTKIINSQGTQFRDDFYMSLSEVFLEDLRKYELEDSILKFTGDGILISIISANKLINLLCFSFKTKLYFNEQLNNLLGVPSNEFDWGIRIGISSANDIVKEIFGKTDVIGDSVRKAVRTLNFVIKMIFL